MSEVTISDEALVADPQPFAEYLVAHGAEILEPTNPYEVLRYRMEECGVIVIYKNGKGKLTSMPALAWHHYNDFKLNRAPIRFGRPGSNAKENLIAAVRTRDGDGCCYCSTPLGDDVTIEHWLSLKDGGSNSRANVGLAHTVCNQAADSVPIMTKIKIREALTLASLAVGGRLSDDVVQAIATSIKALSAPDPDETAPEAAQC